MWFVPPAGPKGRSGGETQRCALLVQRSFLNLQISAPRNARGDPAVQAGCNIPILSEGQRSHDGDRDTGWLPSFRIALISASELPNLSRNIWSRTDKEIVMRYIDDIFTDVSIIVNRICYKYEWKLFNRYFRIGERFLQLISTPRKWKFRDLGNIIAWRI